MRRRNSQVTKQNRGVIFLPIVYFGEKQCVFSVFLYVAFFMLTYNFPLIDVALHLSSSREIKLSIFVSDTSERLVVVKSFKDFLNYGFSIKKIFEEKMKLLFVYFRGVTLNVAISTCVHIEL